MNLVLDIGNTVVKAGIFSQEQLLLKGNFSSIPVREPDEWGILLRNWIQLLPGPYVLDVIVVASVVQRVHRAISRALPRYFDVPVIELSHRVSPVPILCDDPAQLGADRIANVVAVNRLYKCPAIVIDFGTATTFDVVSAKGEYIGGVIAPGVRAASDSLWQKAERLFPVDFSKPDRVIGTNTHDNLLSGLFYTWVGMMDEIVRRVVIELGQKPTVVVTGGWGDLFGSESMHAPEINSNLTLQGLNYVALFHNPR